MARRGLIVCGLLAALLALFVYEPLPEGWKQPWKTRILLASYRLKNHLAYAGEFVGLSNPVTQNFIMDTLAPYVLRAPHLADINSRDTEIDGVPVRVYSPAGAKDGDILPGVIYYHGGGWTVGSVVMYDNVLRRMVKDTGFRAISVNYRLAPEHTFPAPFDDCVAVTKYVLGHAAEFFIDKDRVAVAGDSAGGNYAVAISLKLRDDKFPIRPKLQVLIYAAVQFIDLATPSYQANKDGPLITAVHVGEYLGYYLQGNPKNANDFIRNKHITASTLKKYQHYLNVGLLPDDDIKRNYKPLEQYTTTNTALANEVGDLVLDRYISPLLVDDLSDLPFSYIFACQNDVLRDDSIWFYQRRGPKSAVLDVLPCFHGCVNLSEDLESASEAMARIDEFIKGYL